MSIGGPSTLRPEDAARAAPRRGPDAHDPAGTPGRGRRVAALTARRAVRPVPGADPRAAAASPARGRGSRACARRAGSPPAPPRRRGSPRPAGRHSIAESLRTLDERLADGERARPVDGHGAADGDEPAPLRPPGRGLHGLDQPLQERGLPELDRPPVGAAWAIRGQVDDRVRGRARRQRCRPARSCSPRGPRPSTARPGTRSSAAASSPCRPTSGPSGSRCRSPSSITEQGRSGSSMGRSPAASLAASSPPAWPSPRAAGPSPRPGPARPGALPPRVAGGRGRPGAIAAPIVPRRAGRHPRRRAAVVHLRGRRSARPAARTAPSAAVPRATFVSVVHERGAQPVPGPDRERHRRGGGARTSPTARAQAGVEPTVRWNPDTRTHQVRVGDLPTREAAQALSARLPAVGLAGGWVVEEPRRLPARPAAPAGDGRRGERARADPRRAERDALAADGLTYRGYLEVRAGEGGPHRHQRRSTSRTTCGASCPTSSRPTAFPAARGA